MMAIAGPEIVTGGASAPPALLALPMPRTITDGVLSLLGGAHAEAA
jgi:hypothetical protein